MCKVDFMVYSMTYEKCFSYKNFNYFLADVFNEQKKIMNGDIFNITTWPISDDTNLGSFFVLSRFLSFVVHKMQFNWAYKRFFFF